MDTDQVAKVTVIDLNDYDAGIMKLRQLKALVVSMSGPAFGSFVSLSEPTRECIISLAAALATDALHAFEQIEIV